MLTKKELHDFIWDKWPSCGCGDLGSVVELLRDVLDWIAWSSAGDNIGIPHSQAQKPGESWDDFHKRYHARREELFPPDHRGLEFQYLYLLAHFDLTEHGGGVPGWLTPDGWDLLEALQAYGTDPDAWEDEECQRDGHR